MVRSKSPDACELLHRKFKSFLSLPKSLLNVAAFLAVVKDSLKGESSGAETVSNNRRGSSSSMADLSDEAEEDGHEKGKAKMHSARAKPSRRSVRAPIKRYREQVCLDIELLLMILAELLILALALSNFNAKIVPYASNTQMPFVSNAWLNTIAFNIVSAQHFYFQFRDRTFQDTKRFNRWKV